MTPGGILGVCFGGFASQKKGAVSHRGAFCDFADNWLSKGTPGHTPGTAYTRLSQSPKWKEFRNINCWLGVWGMFQGYVWKFLEVDKHNLAGPTRREWGSLNLYWLVYWGWKFIPSFPTTKGQLVIGCKTLILNKRYPLSTLLYQRVTVDCS